MTCEQIKQYMCEYIDDELDDAAKKAFEAHLAECSRCRHDLEDTKNAVFWLKQAEDIDPPPNLRQSVIQTLKQEQPLNRRQRFAPGFIQFAAAAAVFIMLAAGNLIPSGMNMLSEPPDDYGQSPKSVLLEADDADLAGSENEFFAAESDSLEQSAPPDAEIDTRVNTADDSAEKLTVSGREGTMQETAADAADDSAAGTSKWFTRKTLLNLIGIPLFVLLVVAAIKKRKEALLP